MSIDIIGIAGKADALVKKAGTADPCSLAESIGIDIIRCGFKRQKGAYKIVLGNRFIFVKSDLDEQMKNIVILHEIGHDVLHRDEALLSGGFREFNIFGNLDVRMECEANIFAAQAQLPDDVFLEYMNMGYSVRQIAAAMNTDINLAEFKINILSEKGYPLGKVENNNRFLK